MRPLWCLAHEQRDADDGEDAERKVDVEHPAPAVEVGQIAAERRADHRPHGDAHGEDRHRLGAARERIDVEHRRLRQRRECGAEHALQQAEADQLLQRLCRAAHHRCDGEAGDADDEQPLAAEADGHPADRGGHDGGGDHVGGEHPGDLVVRRRHAALHVGQRDIGDGGVQRLHEHRQHGGGGDQAAIRDAGCFGHCSWTLVSEWGDCAPVRGIALPLPPAGRALHAAATPAFKGRWGSQSPFNAEPAESAEITEELMGTSARARTKPTVT